MNKKAHSNPKSFSWVIGLIVIIVSCVLVTVVADFGLDKYHEYKLKNDPLAGKLTQEQFLEAMPNGDIGSIEAIDVAGYKGDDFTIDAAFKNKDGYVILGTATNGFKEYGADGILTLALGIGNDNAVKGIEIIKCDGTEGYGMNMLEDDYTALFTSLNAGAVTFVKQGTPDAAANEIDAISGATYSSTALNTLVNGIMSFYGEKIANTGAVTAPELAVKEFKLDAKTIVESTVAGADGSTAEEVEIADFKLDNFKVDNVYKYADGYVIVGTAIQVDGQIGYAGDLKIALGIDSKDTVNGFYVISCDGTPGFGEKMLDDSFAAMFPGLKVGAVNVVDSGAKTDKNEIDGISGATYSTNAVKVVTNGILAYYNEKIAGNAAFEIPEVDAVSGATA